MSITEAELAEMKAWAEADIADAQTLRLIAEIENLRAALREWEESCKYDATMACPKFLSYNRSQLDRARKSMEVRLAIPGNEL